MSNYVQKAKQLVDVGEKGNANTGDIIYDGGVKLNDNLDAIYNTFGDMRLWDNNLGIGNQLLHSTGYYQKLPTSYYTRKAVEPGSMHDLDTTTTTFVVKLPNPKRGECVEFINSNNSFEINEIIFQPQAGADISGLNELRLRQGKIKIIFTCTDETPNSAKWEYKIEPMFGDFSVPVNTSITVERATPVNIRLFEKDAYAGVKFVISAEEVKAGVRERTVSEVLIMIDPEDNKIYSDEYSVIFKTMKVYGLEFNITGNNAIAKVTALSDRIKFAIKSIETIKAL